MPAIPIPTLLAESACYACFAPGDVPSLSKLALLSRMASVTPCTAAPAAPTMDSPPVFSSPGNYTLSWNAVPGAVSYWVFVASDADFLFPIADAQTTGTSQAFSDVTGAIRYARVYAINACGNSDYSNVINFNSDGSIVFSAFITYSDTGGVLTTWTTPAYQPSSNALLLAFIYSNQPITSVTGNGLTWVLVNQNDPATMVSGIQGWVYRAMGPAPTNTGLTVVGTIAPSTGILIHVQQYTAVNTSGSNGSGAVYQNISIAQNAATIAPLNPSGLNAIVGSTVTFIDPPAGVLESGWTQDLNQGQGAGVQIGAFIAHRIATTDNSYTSSIAGFTFNTIVLEIVSALSSSPTVALPSAIANLEIWSKSDTAVYKDAAKTIPCTANGDAVYTWGNVGNTVLTADWIQAVLGLRPVFNVTGGINGKPRISFNSNKMVLLSGSFLQPFTLVIVANYTGNVGAFGTYFWSSDGGIEFGIDPAALNKLLIYAGSARHGTIPITSSPALSMCTVNGSGSPMFVNAVACLGSPTVGAGALTASLGIGGDTTSTYFLIGDMYEVMMFSRVLTVAEISKIQIYAKNRYNLLF